MRTRQVPSSSPHPDRGHFKVRKRMAEKQYDLLSLPDQPHKRVALQTRCWSAEPPRWVRAALKCTRLSKLQLPSGPQAVVEQWPCAISSCLCLWVTDVPIYLQIVKAPKTAIGRSIMTTGSNCESTCIDDSF